MHESESSTALLEPPEAKRRSTGSRLATLGGRLARGIERVRPEPNFWEPGQEFEYPLPDDGEPPREPPQGRFPVVRHGYDPDLVEECLAELERELEQARAGAAVAATEEIARIGEQTASILRVAHAKAQEMSREARAQSDALVAQATTEAEEITREAKREAARLDSDTDAIWRERERLLEDARSVATALFTLIDEAAERFPAESERTSEYEAIADMEPTGEGAAAPPEASASPAPVGAVPVVAEPVDRSLEPLDDADPGLPPEDGPGLGV